MKIESEQTSWSALGCRMVGPCFSTPYFPASSAANRRNFLVFFLTLLTQHNAEVTAAPTFAGLDTCESNMPGLQNSAFVFIKPHANTPATHDLVVDKLSSAGIKILSQVDIGGEEIDQKGLIDQHYYSIASKATILPADEIPVPRDKFKEAFEESWDDVLSEQRACNAVEACHRFQCTPAELNEAWGKVEAVKFGGGFYCARMSVNDKPELYVFNAFFMAMRAKFVGKENEIRCFVVEWDPSELSWSSFRNDVLGPTDPSIAPKGSIRRTILDEYERLGLSNVPNKGDNGVHASASPFEGLAERMNWLDLNLSDDDGLGKALLEGGMSKERIQEWAKDPQIRISESEFGSVFDSLEDLDVTECSRKLIELNKLNP